MSFLKAQISKTEFYAKKFFTAKITQVIKDIINKKKKLL